MPKSPVFLTLLGLIATVSIASGQYNTGNTVPGGNTLEAAKKMVIPQVDFRDASLQEVIAFLEKKSFELDPAKGRTAKGINIIASVPPGFDRKITLSLSNQPLLEILGYVCSLTDLKILGVPYAIILEDPRTNDSAPFFVPIKPGSPQAAFMDRTMKMIVPSANLSGATLAESLDFVRAQSALLNPQRKPVDIVVKGTPFSAAARTTLTVYNVPLPVLLNYICSLSGLRMQVKPEVFYLHPWEDNVGE